MNPENNNNSLERASESTNRIKLQELMGDDYNQMEMDDLLSYLTPGEVAIEIGIFEEKVKSKRQARELLIPNFKGHLAYLAG